MREIRMTDRNGIILITEGKNFDENIKIVPDFTPDFNNAKHEVHVENSTYEANIDVYYTGVDSNGQIVPMKDTVTPKLGDTCIWVVDNTPVTIDITGSGTTVMLYDKHGDDYSDNYDYIMESSYDGRVIIIPDATELGAVYVEDK